MSFNYTLKYRTLEQLIAAVKADFRKYNLNDDIMDQDLIKVAQRVTYDLGLRINKTKEVVLEVEKGRVRLPNDFYVLNYALMCGSYERKQYLPQGTDIEEKIIDPVVPVYQPTPPNTIDVCTDAEIPKTTECDPCSQCGNPCCEDQCQCCLPTAPSCSINCKGEAMQLVQRLSYETRVFNTLRPIHMLQNAQDIDCDCPNLYWASPYTGWIKDGWLYLNIEQTNERVVNAKVYINYQGAMEDEDGNLLVVDHDMINEYYEYALKQRILENLIMNGEQVNQTQIQLIEQRYRVARNYAKCIVNTPNYGELKQMWKANRRAMYDKYYNMFASYAPLQNFTVPLHNKRLNDIMNNHG